MSDKANFLPNEVYEYLLKVGVREHPVSLALRQFTEQLSSHPVHIDRDQAQFMGFLLKVLDAKRVLELGTYTGYSALNLALALPQDGSLLTVDIDDRFLNSAREYWVKAGVDAKIKTHVGPALKFMEDLLEAGQAGYYDFIFIDADKQNYLHYYELGLSLLSPKGVLAIDNVLWFGRLVQLPSTRKSAEVIKALNEKIQADERVELTLLPIGGGLTLVKKR